MKDLFLFIFATIGLTWAVVKGGIFRPIRELVSEAFIKRQKNIILIFLNEVLNCNKCFGLWSGLTCYALQYHKIDVLLYAFSGIFLSWVAFDYINKK